MIANNQQLLLLLLLVKAWRIGSTVNFATTLGGSMTSGSTLIGR